MINIPNNICICKDQSKYWYLYSYLPIFGKPKYICTCICLKKMDSEYICFVFAQTCKLEYICIRIWAWKSYTSYTGSKQVLGIWICSNSLYLHYYHSYDIQDVICIFSWSIHISMILLLKKMSWHIWLMFISTFHWLPTTRQNTDTDTDPDRHSIYSE